MRANSRCISKRECCNAWSARRQLPESPRILLGCLGSCSSACLVFGAFKICALHKHCLKHLQPLALWLR